MKSEFCFSVLGLFVGVDFRTWRLRLERVLEQTRHPFRVYRSWALWVGPLCLIGRGRFEWVRP